MKITLDTVCLKHLARKPKPPRRAKHGSDISHETGLQRLETHIKERKVQLYVDKAGSLFDEWRRTCGPDVMAVVDAWESMRGFIPVTPLNALPADTNDDLEQFGFRDPGDRLILKITLAASERRIVSDDPDYWDPRDARSRGDTGAEVCKYLRENHDIETLLLAWLMQRLSR